MSSIGANGGALGPDGGPDGERSPKHTHRPRETKKHYSNTDKHHEQNTPYITTNWSENTPKKIENFLIFFCNNKNYQKER